MKESADLKYEIFKINYATNPSCQHQNVKKYNSINSCKKCY